VRTLSPNHTQPATTSAQAGMESELALKPRFLAPDYRGSGKLEAWPRW
jgi:hypothetical protein